MDIAAERYLGLVRGARSEHILHGSVSDERQRTRAKEPQLAARCFFNLFPVCQFRFSSLSNWYARFAFGSPDSTALMSLPSSATIELWMASPCSRVMPFPPWRT